MFHIEIVCFLVAPQRVGSTPPPPRICLNIETDATHMNGGYDYTQIGVFGGEQGRKGTHIGLGCLE